MSSWLLALSTLPVDRAVDRALGVHRPPLRIDRPIVEIELHDVVALDELRAARAGEEIVVRAPRMSNADVAEGVDHALVAKDPVGEDKVVQDTLEVRLFRRWIDSSLS